MRSYFFGAQLHRIFGDHDFCLMLGFIVDKVLQLFV